MNKINYQNKNSLNSNSSSSTLSQQQQQRRLDIWSRYRGS
jgi:hypothetical protein